jgi:hypothetical protein
VEFDHLPAGKFVLSPPVGDSSVVVLHHEVNLIFGEGLDDLGIDPKTPLLMR